MAASNGSVKLVDRHKLNQISAVHPCCIYNYSFWNWGPDFSNPTWLDLLSVGSLMGAIPHKWELLQSGWIYSSFGLSSFGFTIRCKHVGYVVVPSSYMWIDCKDAGSKLDCKMPGYDWEPLLTHWFCTLERLQPPLAGTLTNASIILHISCLAMTQWSVRTYGFGLTLWQRKCKRLLAGPTFEIFRDSKDTAQMNKRSNTDEQSSSSHKLTMFVVFSRLIHQTRSESRTDDAVRGWRWRSSHP